MNQTTPIQIEVDELEGTQASFSSWLIKLGDRVEKGQPIAELETDKVAMEVCAPQSGIIVGLDAKQGDAVKPLQKLGEIEQQREQEYEVALERAVVQVETEVSPVYHVTAKAQGHSTDSINRQQLSPAVRRRLMDHQLDSANIQGTGRGGRITRHDIEILLQSRKNKAQTETSHATTKVEYPTPKQPIDQQLPAARLLQGKSIPHSNMRRSIASHMVESLLQISPHVTSIFEMDMGNIIEHRKWHKKEFAEHGAKLTFTAYFLMAMAKAVAKVPQVNARFHADSLEVFSDVNIGVGTALGEEGLVVPVVHQVQSLNLFQIAKALTLQTEKARQGKLTSRDLKNGTLTISNHGVSGSLIATPIIINQPQVAILGVGKLEKRVVVEQKDGQDQMLIRPKCYVSLTIDHRALDAHQTNLFLSQFVSEIETWGE
ncbi:MAG: dihydrolipoamide acetyltransferase family protein [Enterobacterales bacterium]|nr:dihydrolipoamide acetyltransferase family protein [Enterobacterales bacterium]